MKYLSLIAVLFLIACSESPDGLELPENEKQLIGNWFYSNKNGQVQGYYMEFHNDRTGVFGPVININGKKELTTYTTLLMKNWSIKNDTLYIQSEMQAGLDIVGPDGIEIEQNLETSILRYVVHETSDSYIVLEDLEGHIPVKKEFKKSEKISVMN